MSRAHTYACLFGMAMPDMHHTQGRLHTASFCCKREHVGRCTLTAWGQASGYTCHTVDDICCVMTVHMHMG